MALIPVPRVKICGIRCRRDLDIALAAGADALGFIVGARHRTEDELSPGDAASLVALLPPFVSSVLVTHLQEPRAILAISQEVAATTLQLQDAMAAEAIHELRCRLPGVKLIQAIHVLDEGAIPAARAAEAAVDALLLDSRTADRIGGTGQPHDWTISRKIVEQAMKPVILAGGLKPENLTRALSTVGPAAVDVNSGVEDAAGHKDPDRCRAFVRLAHASVA
jgi:phosphoribosylanthranilate isomerase